MKNWFFYSLSVLMLSTAISCRSSQQSAPTFTVNVSSGSAIFTSQKIVITFSTSIDTARVSFGGSMAADTNTPVWSETNFENDTITLSPKKFWSGDGTATLTVDGSDKGGNTIENANFAYNVILKIENFHNASFVFGQPDLISNQFNAGQGASTVAYGVSDPRGAAAFHQGILYLPDTENNRVLGLLNGLPTQNGQSADFVIGQQNLNSSTIGASANLMTEARSVVINNGKMYVMESGNHRISVFNQIPTTTNPTIDFVIGQADLVSNDSNCSATTFEKPVSMWIAGGKLIVADNSNNRVLIWTTLPTSSGQAANLVLGQEDFNSCGVNGGGGATSASVFNGPSGVWSDGNKLIVLDSNNHRALIWNQFPTLNKQEADILLGQSNFTYSTKNDDNQNNEVDVSDTPTASTLNFPSIGVFSRGKQLFISDSFNHRVLVWDTFPTTNFQPADHVIGQFKFNTNMRNDGDQDGLVEGPTSSRTLYSPTGIYAVDDQLIIADRSNSRFLFYKGL